MNTCAALTLVAPLSANDIVAILATAIAGVVLIIRALKPAAQTPADAKAETLQDVVVGLQSMVQSLTEQVGKALLAAQPPAAQTPQPMTRPAVTPTTLIPAAPTAAPTPPKGTTP